MFPHKIAESHILLSLYQQLERPRKSSPSKEKEKSYAFVAPFKEKSKSFQLNLFFINFMWFHANTNHVDLF